MAVKGMGLVKAIGIVSDLDDETLSAIEFILGWYGSNTGPGVITGIRVHKDHVGKASRVDGNTGA